MARLNEKGINAVKKAVVTAATGPIGSTMGQAGKVAQTFGLPAFEGEKMPAGGALKEVTFQGKPLTKASSVELDDVIKINGKTYKMEDLVTQMNVLKSQFPENHPVMYLVRNLKSGLGTTKYLKPDLRGDQSSSVDTIQRKSEVYQGAPRIGKYKNALDKSIATAEGIEYSTRSGKKIGNIIERGNAESILDTFLQKRGVKEARDLSKDKETSKANK